MEKRGREEEYTSAFKGSRNKSPMGFWCTVFEMRSGEYMRAVRKVPSHVIKKPEAFMAGCLPQTASVHKEGKYKTENLDIQWQQLNN